MLATEQTVVLLGRMTSFTAVCEACQEEQRAELLEESWLGGRGAGTPRVGGGAGGGRRGAGMLGGWSAREGRPRHHRSEARLAGPGRGHRFDRTHGPGDE